MPIEINNSEMLVKVFKSELQSVMKNIANSVYKQLKSNIKGVYKNVDSLSYQRTYDFLNAVIVPEISTSKNGVSVVIGIDYKKIAPRITKHGMLNAHADVHGGTSWNGISISEALLTWLDEGTTNSKIHNKGQSNYWYDVMGARGYNVDPEVDYKKLDELINNEIKKSFAKIGVVTKKSL